MAVSTTPQDLIPALDTNWAERARENTRRANLNDANLKTAVEELQNAAAPVRKIKQGATTYNPDANGLVTLPSGVVAPATTTTERDAIVGPTVGQLIYNTTTARLEVYTATGWRPVGSSQVDVFTASGTWTKPDGARLVLAIAIGGGGAGNSYANAAVGQNFFLFGGGGGARAEALVPAGTLPATVPVTVGAGGAGTTAASGASQIGGDGGYSAFGTSVVASGGKGGNNSSNPRAGNIGGYGGLPGSTIPDTVNPGGTTNAALSVSYLPDGHGGFGCNDVPSNYSRPGSSNYYGDSVKGAGGGGCLYLSNPVTGVDAGVTGMSMVGGTALTSRAAFITSASTATGNAGASRSGSGSSGDGGAALWRSSADAVTATGGAGGLPGGGGGGVGRPSGGAAVGGSGGRGEVVVITLF